MKRKIVSAMFFSLLIAKGFAGGLLTNTNQSVHFLREPSREASTEIDAVYTNPAGLVYLTDGFHLSVTNQSAFQTRTITSTFAPFAGDGGGVTKVFRGEASAPIIPSFQLAYKKGNYVISTAFAITGGGGEATFNHGLPSFEAPISMIPVSLTAAGVPTTAYSVDGYMQGRQFLYGFQLNGSYKLNHAFSVAAGLRLNIASNAYQGHLRNIMINPQHPVLNPTGEMMLATLFFNNAASLATGAANSLTPIVDGGYGSATLAQLQAAGKLTAAQVAQLSAGLGTDVSGLQVTQVQNLYNKAAATYTTNAHATADKYLDCTQTGWGVTPIIGFDYHEDNWNVGLKYEFKTSLNIQNNTVIDDTGLFPDGVNTPSDVPALLTLGVAYQLPHHFNFSVGYHHFFDSDAKMANNKQQYIHGGVNEYLFGGEYTVNSIFLVSAGAQITRTGVTDPYQSDMSFSLNSYSVGFGGAVNLTSKLRLNLAYFFTNYAKWTKQSSNYNNTMLAGTDVFARTNKVFGIGVDYNF
jgi:long-subunit fatty acid transport protein